MQIKANVLIFYCICLVAMVHLTSAMYGLCSTEHHLNNACNDNYDRCKEVYNGTCTYGAGDHNEGCQCIVRTYRNGKWIEKIMTENHLPKDVTKTTNKPNKATTTSNKKTGP
ncbi:uncharacterized protein LOC132713602 [Ruditapes philippinarum]|uniref:uncharacterized protein LOC132713602 n=1 Tax=Ruditapes philippinarum TaxID=129788 RepID=UPI00295AB9FF|nr:uncharacterized protein LOC132713602 [Ruditapes philippinarum]